MDLTNRTALITGGTAGIGLATAEALHKAGARLVLAGRRPERIAELEARWPGTVGLAGDIADPALPERLLALALERTGRCDVVFNNAGLMSSGMIPDVDIEKVCEMVRVNVEGAYRMAYVAMRHFQSVGEGQLVFTSSVLGTKVRKGAHWYCGTKFAVEALAEGLRMECAGTRIRVGCVEPALTQTELHRHHAVPPAKAQGMSQPLLPEDVARAVLFMLQQPDHVAMPRVMLQPAEQEI